MTVIGVFRNINYNYNGDSFQVILRDVLSKINGAYTFQFYCPFTTAIVVKPGGFTHLGSILLHLLYGKQ